MSDNYTELYYHIVWRTRLSEQFISPDLEPALYNYLVTLCRRLNVEVLALNGMPDHVHLVCKIPPTVSLSQLVKDLKGKSARFVNDLPDFRLSLAWQPGYAALTFAKRNLASVVRYVRDQKEHHAQGGLLRKLEITGGSDSDLSVAEGLCSAAPRTEVQG